MQSTEQPPVSLRYIPLINLLALATAKSKTKNIPIQTSSWYKKTHVTFSDVLTYVRKQILRRKYIHWFDKNNEIENRDFKEIIKRMAAA
jgi:hypothetical protein